MDIGRLFIRGKWRNVEGDRKEKRREMAYLIVHESALQLFPCDVLRDRDLTL